MIIAEGAPRRIGTWTVAVAVASVLVIWWVWDGIVPIPAVHDETSYLLQADIFARGRWTAPSPPVPEFFEQPHVLVTPAVASKYPPGHALLLSIGSLAGFPPLMPLLLTGITAALLFALTARLWNAWVALLSWAAWLTAPIVLRFQPSYFSELTTTALLLGSWWALLEWRETRRRTWLLSIAMMVGWGAITRPLTMLALALPIGIVVLHDVTRSGGHAWRDLALGLAAGVAVLCVIPLWSAKTTGDWRLTPVEMYRRDYLPFDKLGFTPDRTPPRKLVSAVMQKTYDYILVAHEQHRVESLHRITLNRLFHLGEAYFGGARLLLLPFAAIGFFVGGPALRFAAFSAAALFLAYLSWAYWAGWTLYYLETAPVVAALIGVGVWRAARRVARTDERSRLLAIAVSLVMLVGSFPAMDHWRRDHRRRGEFDRQFAREVEGLPSQPAIVFMRYSPKFGQHVSVVFNHADLASEPVWVVHDLGERNAELRRAAPDRAVYYFDEGRLPGK